MCARTLLRASSLARNRFTCRPSVAADKGARVSTMDLDPQTGIEAQRNTHKAHPRGDRSQGLLFSRECFCALDQSTRTKVFVKFCHPYLMGCAANSAKFSVTPQKKCSIIVRQVASSWASATLLVLVPSLQPFCHNKPLAWKPLSS